MKFPGAIKYSLFSAVLFVLLSAGVAFGGIPTEVVISKSVLVNLKEPASRVSVANPAIAEVNLISPRQIQINGTALGATSMIVWERGGGKPVFFDLKVVGDQALVESQIKAIAPDDPISAQYSNDTIVLTGTTNKYKTRAKAEEIAKSYASKVLNYINVDDPQQVLLQVKVVQVDRTSLKKLGISGMLKGKTAEGFYNLISAPSGGATVSTTSSGSGFSSSQTVAEQAFQEMSRVSAALTHWMHSRPVFLTSPAGSERSSRRWPRKIWRKCWPSQTSWSRAVKRANSWPAAKYLTIS